MSTSRPGRRGCRSIALSDLVLRGVLYFLLAVGLTVGWGGRALLGATPQPPCDPDDGGLRLPDGFCAVVVADNLGPARHLTVGNNGDVYVFLRRPMKDGGIVALRDRDGDGKADRIEYFGEYGGTGIELRDGYLYLSPGDRVVRYPIRTDELVPSSSPETVVSSLFAGRSHGARPITFDGQGNMYVNIGAPSNNCMKQSRTRGSPGQKPCPLLSYSGGIWQFRADGTDQRQEDASRYVSGIRNAVAIDWNHRVGELYLVQHGRDQLHQFFPDLYSVEDNAELPAEELLLAEKGTIFSWPYCYYDQRLGKRVRAPEYGGDGRKTDGCGEYPDPLYGFPGHYGPNDLLFYTGTQFPSRYQNGAFVAFHGSWNRAPLEQKGYMVAFLPFRGETPSVQEPDGHQVFAEGFKGTQELQNPRNAEYRPTGLALGPDGSLYVSDSQKGRVWRILYTGE